ncbi:leukotriene B4 receptor 1-like [Pygocentrus nattereri]|uniref:G-protein coupled receptors family 1 profile domain-containing protein n=1 Tax=Pygocentrus nattereri TaxID=42514 RepID=A0A3B4CVH9_PYGNA|nr:leukotriene B4 receptor 1-like [Pygocentrus nattereri]
MQQDNCSSSSQLTDIFPVCIANSAIMGLCFVLGVPGNLSVLGILVRRLKENSFTLRIMLTLAMSDLLILLPLPIWIWALLHDWIFGSVVCKIISYIEYWCVYCSALCVTLMSVQRYMQVLHPQKCAKLGTRGENGLLCGIWILSGLLALYAPVQRDVGCDQYGFLYCYQHFRNDTEKVVTLILEMLQFGMCFFLLVFFYYRLHRGVNQSPFFSSNRMTKLVTRIVVSFFVFYILVPIANISIITAVFLKNENLLESVELVGKVARVLAFLNSCVNPCLYTFSLRGQQRTNPVIENT